MAYLDAAEAAKKLGRTERTIRQWIDKKELPAIHPSHGRTNKWLIREEDVDALAKELTEAGDTKKKASEDTLPEIAELRTYIERLEHQHNERITALEEMVKHLTTIDEKASVTTKDTSEHLEQEKRQITIVEPNKAIVEKKSVGRPKGVRTVIEPPVPGAIPHYEFAKRHGVVPRTFADHIDKGIKGDKVDAIVVDHPSRPNEQLRWLTPEQQEAALAFWKANNVYTFLPDEWISLKAFANKHGITKTLAELEDLGHAGHIKGMEFGNWMLREKDAEGKHIKVHVALSPQGQQNALAYFRIK